MRPVYLDIRLAVFGVSLPPRRRRAAPPPSTYAVLLAPAPYASPFASSAFPLSHLSPAGVGGGGGVGGVVGPPSPGSPVSPCSPWSSPGAAAAATAPWSPPPSSPSTRSGGPPGAPASPLPFPTWAGDSPGRAAQAHLHRSAGRSRRRSSPVGRRLSRAWATHRGSLGGVGVDGSGGGGRGRGEEGGGRLGWVAASALSLSPRRQRARPPQRAVIPLPPPLWVELGRTEVVPADGCPSYVTALRLPYPGTHPSALDDGAPLYVAVVATGGSGSNRGGRGREEGPARQAPLTMAMRRVRTTLVAGVAGAGAVVALGSAAPAAAQAGGGGGAPLVTDFAALIDQARCEALAPLRAGIVPTAGNSVTGYVLMAPVWRADTSTCATSVKASLTNMPTAGAAHGFHIHTFGDTTKDDGTSAGGHYNPEDVDHGLPTAEVRHVGDLGNIEVGDDQTAEYDQTSELISLPHVVGRSVVIHADPDDGGQPTGNAGKRLAQGVLGYMETEG